MTAKTAAVPADAMVPLRAYRKMAGITVEDLIERIAAQGVVVKNVSTINNVELGHRRPSEPLRVAWARALGLSPVDLRLVPRTDGCPHRSSHRSAAA